MLEPHRLPERLVLVATLAFFAALRVPAAFAGEPMLEGGNDRGLGAASEPPLLVDAAAGGFDRTAAFVLVVAVIALVAVGAALARTGAAARRGRRLATR